MGTKEIIIVVPVINHLPAFRGAKLKFLADEPSLQALRLPPEGPPSPPFFTSLSVTCRDRKIR